MSSFHTTGTNVIVTNIGKVRGVLHRTYFVTVAVAVFVQFGSGGKHSKNTVLLRLAICCRFPES